VAEVKGAKGTCPRRANPRYGTAIRMIYYYRSQEYFFDASLYETGGLRPANSRSAVAASGWRKGRRNGTLAAMDSGSVSRGSAVRTGVAAACLFAVFVTLAGEADVRAGPAFPSLNERVIDSYVVPHFEKLAKATHRLTEDLSRTCRGEPRAAKAARKDFNETVLAWAGVEFLRFGPMSETGRPERFSYWPDPRGVMQRQLQALIARRDATALDADSLAKKSVAVQGLPALEALLTDTEHPITGDDEEARYRCQLAGAIAQNLDSIARGILSDWSGEQGWRRRMLEPGPQNTNYKTSVEPAADFARALITGLQMIQDRQVAPMIAAVATPDKPLRLPFSRSQLSARYIAAGVASNKELYEAMDLANAMPKEKLWMPRWIASAFERLAHDAPAAVEGSVGAADKSERARALRMVRFHVEGIRKLVGREIAPLAGLTIGFNELDGD